ncbi:MAG: VWA domain-containing protein [Thalassovita sp.]
MSSSRSITAWAAAIALVGTPAMSARNLLFIMDASNSMWGQVDGVAKMDIAKTTLVDLLSDLPSDTSVGLMAYGHREKGDCADVELLNTIQPDGGAAMTQAVQALSPKGKTPLSASLQASAQAFEGLEGPKNVVLISDGVETCGGDACAAAGALSAAGVDVRVHVVGFDLNAEERASLECIADQGKGQYFNAEDTASFAEAVSEAVEAAGAVPEPEPAPILVAQNDTTVSDVPVRTLLWEDEFEGFDLGEDWTVNGPNPDNYVVEDGMLLAIASKNNALDVPEAENVFQRLDDLPRGDWDIDISFFAEFQTGADLLEIGLWKDPENFLTTRIWTEERYCSRLTFGLRKNARGEKTDFIYDVFQNGCGNESAAKMQETVASLFASEGATITLSKRGRSYSAKLVLNGLLDGNGEQIVVTTESLTSLRSPGSLGFSLSKWSADYSGEMLLQVDKIEVFEVE